jgi:hypothetical protein
VIEPSERLMYQATYQPQLASISGETQLLPECHWGRLSGNVDCAGHRGLRQGDLGE